MGYGGKGSKGRKGQEGTAWDAAQTAGTMKHSLEDSKLSPRQPRSAQDLPRQRPQRIVEAFPHLTVASDWHERRPPRSGAPLAAIRGAYRCLEGFLGLSCHLK